MNSNNVCLLCVRCQDGARFVCEQCSDPYCTKKCQILDWRLHRKICFPMPSLVEIPYERNITSMHGVGDIRENEHLALAYHVISQCRSAPKNNNGRKNYNYQRPIRSQSSRQEICVSGDTKSVDSGPMQTLDSKKFNPKLEIQQSADVPKSIPRDETERSESSSTNAIINLGSIKESMALISLTENKSQQLVPKKSPNRNELVTGHINELEQLITNDSSNWRKPFQLENDTFVTVFHFDQSPTTNCWVVPCDYTPKRKKLLHELVRLQFTHETTKNKKIITNEVYAVEYEGNYYRGECLFKISSTEYLIRLIDVGLTSRIHIDAVKSLDQRLKTINAFACEINLEAPLDLTIGQTLRINRFSVDPTGATIVKLAMDEKEKHFQPSSNQKLQVETEPLPVDVPMEMFCLDYSNIEKGYISASINDPVKIEAINRLSDKIGKYVKAGNYFPKSGELCLAYHDAERQWYRGECVDEISSESFEIIFIDYGSTRIVSSSNLRKFASEFTQPAIMHFCCIKGVPPKPAKELIKKIVAFFNENPFFTVAGAKYDDDGVLMVDCPKLTKAIG